MDGVNITIIMASYIKEISQTAVSKDLERLHSAMELEYKQTGSKPILKVKGRYFIQTETFFKDSTNCRKRTGKDYMFGLIKQSMKDNSKKTAWRERHGYILPVRSTTLAESETVKDKDREIMCTRMEILSTDNGKTI